MKLSKPLFGLLAVAAALPCTASEFQNLGFDNVDFSGFVFTNSNGVVFTNLSAGWTAKLLPGWALLADSTPVYTVGLNWHFLDADVASLLDTSFSPVGAGEYSLEFFRAYTNSAVWTIEQTATVPVGTEYVACSFAGNEMALRVNGQNIAPVNPPGPAPSPFGITGPTNLVYSVPSFAGREVQLAFVGPFAVQPMPTRSLGAFCYLDSLRFVSASPRLAVRRSGTNVVMSWPAVTMGYVLQSSASLKPGTWKDAPITPVVSGDEKTGTVTLGSAA